MKKIAHPFIAYILVMSIGVIENMTFDLNRWDQSDRVMYHSFGIILSIFVILKQKYDVK